MLPIVPSPFSSSTFSDTSDAPGAMPAYFFADNLPVPPMMPATCVPWPLSS